MGGATQLTELPDKNLGIESWVHGTGEGHYVYTCATVRDVLATHPNTEYISGISRQQNYMLKFQSEDQY